MVFRNQDYRAEPYEGICQAVVRHKYGRISAGNSGLMVMLRHDGGDGGHAVVPAFLPVMNGDGGSDGYKPIPCGMAYPGISRQKIPVELARSKSRFTKVHCPTPSNLLWF
jgi:hypothetical protein